MSADPGFNGWSAAGGDNGRGGRTYDSVGQILARQDAERSALAKARDTPAELTEDDLRALPGDMIGSLMSAGALTHLGIGARRGPGSRR